MGLLTSDRSRRSVSWLSLTRNDFQAGLAGGVNMHLANVRRGAGATSSFWTLLKYEVLCSSQLKVLRQVQWNWKDDG